MVHGPKLWIGLAFICYHYPLCFLVYALYRRGGRGFGLGLLIAGAVHRVHSNIDDVKRYIANQKEHHKKQDSKDEFRELLEKHGTPFKEEYLL